MIMMNSIKLSPSSLNLFLECPCCFWLEKKKGIRRPQPYPYALNAAVDVLLKEEFDGYRKQGIVHPLLSEKKLNAKLFANQTLLNKWRNNFEGIRHFDEETGVTLFGAVDDVLEFPGGKLAPLDYKSTGSAIPTVYDRFQLQMDVYTYLLEKNGYQTTKKGYLAFYVVDKTNGFNGRLPFKKELQEIDTDPLSVVETFKNAVAVLKRETLPPHSTDCEHGQWLNKASKF
jgi:hypothetical protein